MSLQDNRDQSPPYFLLITNLSRRVCVHMCLHYLLARVCTTLIFVHIQPRCWCLLQISFMGLGCPPRSCCKCWILRAHGWPPLPKNYPPREEPHQPGEINYYLCPGSISVSDNEVKKRSALLPHDGDYSALWIHVLCAWSNKLLWVRLSPTPTLVLVVKNLPAMQEI